MDNFEIRNSEEANYHLSYAFDAFCKSCRNEYINKNEVDALQYCDKNGLHPIKPAILDLPVPYLSFNPYTYAPPDVLHTVLSGILKDWIFNTVVIISKISLSDPSYRHNLQKLDIKLANFPTAQSMPFHMHKFDEGVTPYIKKATGENKGLSTSGLGGINHQQIPSLVLQMLICIGYNGEIIPNHVIINDIIGNLVELIITVGYKALNYFFNLRRTTFLKSDLIVLSQQAESLHTDMLKLFRAKQIILKKRGNYGGKYFIYISYYVNDILCLTKLQKIKNV